MHYAFPRLSLPVPLLHSLLVSGTPARPFQASSHLTFRELPPSLHWVHLAAYACCSLSANLDCELISCLLGTITHWPDYELLEHGYHVCLTVLYAQHQASAWHMVSALKICRTENATLSGP